MKPIRFVGILMVTFLAGCGDDDGPTKPKPSPGPIYGKRSTPQITLENLRLAYEYRDSTETDSVYSPDYQGQSSTVADPGSVLFFTKAEEVSHVGALRMDPSVLDVTVNFGDPSSWTREGSLDAAHPEWASITLSRGVQIELFVGATAYTVGTNDFLEYQFAPETPAPSSPTDTLWTVVRWREIKGAGG